jgi:hypothetical protein
MVAHGTIAFDTLTTSDQVNTGTEKSLDTSYLLNGSLKSWLNMNGQSTIAINDSFNMASITDNGTGSYGATVSNAMSNTYYVAAGEHSSNGGYSANYRILPSTTTHMLFYTQAGNAMEDASTITVMQGGDLA